MNINSNFGNLTSVIKSSFETTPIKEANQVIEELDKKLIKVNKDGVTVDPNKFIADYMKTTSLKEMQTDLKKNKETINQVKETTKQATTELEKMSNVKTNNLNQELDKTDKKIKQITNTSSKSNFGQSLKTVLGIGTVALGIRKAVGFFKEATTESIDFVETQNLFNVSMGKTVDQYGNLDREANKYYTKAMAFQEKLSDKLKINIEESMEYQALFNAMSKSMGIGDEPSYKISENFTKLGYDLSSLYNIDPENAMQKLRAGLSGQTKPLRDLGLDITQQSLEPLLDELGIERSTKQLSQAEKMIARYIVVLRQASLAHGDFAKTMDSPANQLRIFNAQLTAFKRNMGNLWQGLLGNILPYINAIMMVINELLKMIAKLFGFQVSDQNVNISAGIGADDLADDLGTATGKAKELKKQLMGFDEINNISLPDKASGGSGGTSVGGIDQRLLDAMKEYDNMMDKVKSKADEIKNNIMQWLGFYKGLNGELMWSWDRMSNITKILTIIGGILLGKGIWGIINKISKVILGSKLIPFLGKVGFAIKSVVGGVATLGEGIAYVFPWVGKIGKAFSGLATTIGISSGALLGIVGVISAIGLAITYFNVSPAVKQIDIFKGASDETKKKLQGLIDEFNFLGTELKKQDWGNKIITDTDIKKTEESLTKITSAVKEGVTKSKEEALNGFNDTLKTSLGDSMFKEMYDKTAKYYDDQSALIEEKKAQILAIQTKAKDEGRALTEEEVNNISKLYEELEITTVETLSESEEEAKLILGRMVQNAKALSTEQASEIIKESIRTKDETIKNAQDTYTKQVEQAKKLRDVGQITEEEYQKWIDASAEARDNRIKDAEETHQKVYDEFAKENEDIAKYIDEDTGDIKSKWSCFWDEVGKKISTWWENDITPWFTKEKWEELGRKAKEGLEQKFNEFKEKFKPIEDWWNNKIKPWFTKEKWQQLGRDAIQSIQDTFSNFNFKIKMPHFSWDKGGIQAPNWAKGVLEALNLPTSLPKLNVSWYANGGLPTKGELFMAREAGPELVGRMGKHNAVANNDQIIDGIKQGVYEAVMSAMSQQSGGTSRVEIVADEKGIFKVVQQGAEEYYMQTGEPAFNF